MDENQQNARVQEILLEQLERLNDIARQMPAEFLEADSQANIAHAMCALADRLYKQIIRNWQ